MTIVPVQTTLPTSTAYVGAFRTGYRLRAAQPYAPASGQLVAAWQ